jgi:hypothetical protein
MLSIGGFRSGIGTFDVKLEPNSTFLSSFCARSCSRAAGHRAKSHNTWSVGHEVVYVRGHEKVRTFGHEKSAPVATRSPQLWPSDVLTPR